jgi:hypothetical protein
MKSPNNTTDIPDVKNLIDLDYGLCFTKEKRGKINLRTKESVKKNFNSRATLRKSEKGNGTLISHSSLISIYF